MKCEPSGQSRTPRRPSMESNVRDLLNRISLVSATAATLALLYLFSLTSRSCLPILLPPPLPPANLPPPHNASQLLTLSHTPFPTSSCDLSPRRPSRGIGKLRSSPSYLRRVASYTSLLLLLPPLSPRTRALCVSAGAGHAVDALLSLGLVDVTGVDVIDIPPLVSRADPHNLPFFDGVFDLGFSDGVDQALFPRRYVGEMERTVRKGGLNAVIVGRCRGEREVAEVEGLFRVSATVGVWNVTFAGVEATLFLLQKKLDFGVTPR